MAKIWEKLTEVWSSWYDGLSARERRMLQGLSFFLSIALIMATVFIAASKIQHKKEVLASSNKLLKEITALESEFLLAKEKNELALRHIRNNDVSLFTFIQSITSRLGLSVKDLNEQKKPIGKSQVVEVSVRVNLTKLSIDKVTALIEAIETDEEHEGQVKVTRLKINKRSDEPDLLDVQMTVSTWKSA